jgi:hypothetical protein
LGKKLAAVFTGLYFEKSQAITASNEAGAGISCEAETLAKIRAFMRQAKGIPTLQPANSKC